MALRVLLADESSTIKKVIQLSLHDFGVEIKSVGNGLDALSLVDSYRPDLIFVDVLLSKKSGYEVIREIKTHPDLGQIPVVLMWSGFMQLDETKAKASQADARLEKPFDSEQLREIVQKLVPKTKTNPVSQFLVFPQMPEFQENQRPAMGESRSAETSKMGSSSQKQPEASFSAEAEGGWSQQSLAKKTSTGTTSATHEEFEEFSFDDLSLPQLPPEKREVEQKQAMSGDLHEKTSSSISQRPLHPETTQAPSTRATSAETSPSISTKPASMTESIVIKPPTPSKENIYPANQNTNFSQAPAEASRAAAPAVSEARVEEIIREEVRMILQRLCTKLVPEIAERAVKEEIQKILSTPPPGV